HSHPPYIALAMVLMAIIHSYLWVCLDEWKANSRKDSARSIFDFFQGKNVHVIDSSQFNSLHVSVHEKKKKAA
ncbi:MAG: hypothetical protein ACXVLQ_17865, partial [Bacteriovorax sp.]